MKLKKILGLKKDFLTIIICISIVSPVWGNFGIQTKGSSHDVPNIILIMIDQMRLDHLT